MKSGDKVKIIKPHESLKDSWAYITQISYDGEGKVKNYEVAIWGNDHRISYWVEPYEVEPANQSSKSFMGFKY